MLLLGIASFCVKQIYFMCTFDVGFSSLYAKEKINLESLDLGGDGVCFKNQWQHRNGNNHLGREHQEGDVPRRLLE